MIAREIPNPSILSNIKKKPIAIIPVGSIEQHGPHLPISTDSDIISHIARKVSEGTGYLLVPTIEYGVSFEHSPFFNLSVKPSTLQKNILEICLSLWKNGIKTMIILNGHHGNQNALKNIPEKASRMSGFKGRIRVYSYWNFMKRKFDHAGFVETSIMLAISKKVKMNKAVKGLVPDGLSRKKLAELNRLSNYSFIQATKNGVWGDPREANAKDGRSILDEIIKSLTNRVKLDSLAKA